MNNYLDHAFVTLLTTTNPWHTLIAFIKRIPNRHKSVNIYKSVEIEFSWELLNRFPVSSYILSVNAWVSK